MQRRVRSRSEDSHVRRTPLDLSNTQPTISGPEARELTRHGGTRAIIDVQTTTSPQTHPTTSSNPFTLGASFSDIPPIPPFNLESPLPPKAPQAPRPKEKHRLKKLFAWTIGPSGPRPKAPDTIPRRPAAPSQQAPRQNTCDPTRPPLQTQHPAYAHDSPSTPPPPPPPPIPPRLQRDSAITTCKPRSVTPPERVVSPRLAGALQTYSIVARALDVPARAPERPKGPVMGRRRGEMTDV